VERSIEYYGNNYKFPSEPYMQINLLCVTLAAENNDQQKIQIGRDDERSFDTRLASVVSRWLGRSVGAWDPA